MAIHDDTKRLVEYRAANFPSLGNTDRFISKQLDDIAKSLNSITTVLRAIETRLNNNGLS